MTLDTTSVTLSISDDDTTFATIAGEPFELIEVFLTSINGRGGWIPPLWGELLATAWGRRWGGEDSSEDMVRTFWRLTILATNLAASAGAPAQPNVRHDITYETVTGTRFILDDDHLVIIGRPGAVLRRLRVVGLEPEGLDGARLRHAAAREAVKTTAEQLRMWETAAGVVMDSVEISRRGGDHDEGLDEDAL